jgi:hypothetical protein
MITYLSLLAVGFIAGFLVHRKHAANAASLEARGKGLLDALKGK